MAAERLNLPLELNGELLQSTDKPCCPVADLLRQVSRRQSNLIVMGMGRRPGEKLFLGESASSLLEDSEVSLLFVAS